MSRYDFLQISDENKSLSEKVYESLKEAIIKGNLNPGERLLVLELADHYSISQAPIREAFERLKQEELIISRPNKGAMVSDVDIKEIEDLYELRALIEGFAVTRTMENLNEAQIEYLIDLYSKMKIAAKDNNLYKLIELDVKFHGFFYENCGNSVVLRTWENMRTKIMRFTAKTNRVYFPNLLEVADTHIPLIKVIESGDIEKTKKLFIEHMKEIWWRIKQS